MSALVIAAVVRDGDIAVIEPLYTTQRQKAARFWGDGVELRVTIEPAPEAISRAQRAYYFAAVVEPLVEYTGYPKDWWHDRFKEALMPDDGRTSITQLDHDEMGDFIAVSEYYAVDRHPEAFAEFDLRKKKTRRVAA